MCALDFNIGLLFLVFAAAQALCALAKERKMMNGYGGGGRGADGAARSEAEA